MEHGVLGLACAALLCMPVTCIFQSLRQIIEALYGESCSGSGKVSQSHRRDVRHNLPVAHLARGLDQTRQRGQV